MTRPMNSISTPTVHLIGPGKIKVLNGRLAFSTGKGSPTRLDPQHLQQLICYGSVGISDDAFQMLFRHDVKVSWLSPRGNKFRGRLSQVVDSAALLRGMQHQLLANRNAQLALAQQIVGDKIHSQIEISKHFQRRGVKDAGPALRRLQSLSSDATCATNIARLRGLEGISSKLWFELFGKLIQRPWVFTNRTRRPPTDPVNALLSLAYTWLASKTTARVEAAGLETNIGALHDFRPGRPSLVCDLVEPLRAPIVDRWVIKMCNRMWVQPADFNEEKGGIRLVPSAFTNVLAHWEKHWTKIAGHDLLNHQIQTYTSRLRTLSKRFCEQHQDT